VEETELVEPDESLREATISFLGEFREAGESYGRDVWEEVHRGYVVSVAETKLGTNLSLRCSGDLTKKGRIRILLSMEVTN